MVPGTARRQAATMKEPTIRELQANIGRRVSLPLNRPDHADLRQRMQSLQIPSSDLIRAERDEC
jgi:hypothetical protein